MYTKIEIKQESHVIDSQNEVDSFNKDVTIKTESNVVHNNCGMTTKLEMKSQIHLSDFYLNKIEIDEQTMVPDFGSQNENEFLQEDHVKKVEKYNTNDEIDYKGENWKVETEHSFVCDEVKDKDLIAVKTPRLFIEAVYDNSSHKSQLPSTGNSRKAVSSCMEKDRPANGQSKSQGTYVTEKHSEERNIHLEHSSKYDNGGETCTGPSYVKQINVIHKPESSTKCGICKKIFTRVSSLKRHNLIIHVGKKPHKCENCGKRFFGLSHLKNHSLMHKGERPHQCGICEKRFTELSCLKRHHLIHEGKKSHMCEICGKRFVDLSNLKRHNLMHKGEKPHQCGICEKRFTELSHLKEHKLMHEGKRPHKCEICEKRFTQLSHLKTHNLMHEGKRPHKCIICEKRFINSSCLKRHHLIHEGKKLHKCDVCGKRFIDLSNLKRHCLIHKGEKPHKCVICEKRFIRLSNLKSHSLIHEDKMSHNC